MEYLSTEAKNRFGEVLTKAFEEGPQMIKRHGRKAFLISEEDLESLKASAQRHEGPSAVDILLSGPTLTEEEVKVFERGAETVRPALSFE